MSLSYANIQPGKFELTPCRVTYKGVDIGATLGNVVVKIEDSLAELKSDQLGTTVIDRKISGTKITIETEMAQIQLKPNWKVVFPSHKLVTQGGETLFVFDSTMGQSLRDLAGELILHPLSKPDADKSSDFTIPLATAQGKGDVSHSPTEQQKLKLIFDMYPDFSTTPPRFMTYGDTAVGLVAASAGAAVAATGNIGNGTVGSIVAYSGYTKDEVVSLQCVTEATNGGVFFVSGSVTGPMGLATVGVSFVAPEISFLISDGSTDFDTNDSFTITTTAANYV